MLYNKAWEHKPNPLVEVLLKAADLLEQHGHAKGMRYVPYESWGNKGSMCLLGAIDAAQGRNPSHTYNDTPLTILAAGAIVDHLQIPHTSQDARSPAVAWNNAKERTAQEVIDALRLTAHAVAAKEKETV